MVQIDLDASIEAAWRAFEHRLAGDLVELSPGGSLRLTIPIGRSPESPVYLTFAGRPATIRLHAVGAPPTEGPGSSPSLDTPVGVPPVKVFRRGSETAAAAWAVGVLTHSFDVLHPAFLTITHETGGRPGHVMVPVGVNAEPTPSPSTPDELEALVRETLSTTLGSPVEQDSDGDFVVPSAHGPVYVQVLPDFPVVVAFAGLAVCTTADELERAHAYASACNATVTPATHFVSDQALMARRDEWCRPYHAASVVFAVEAALAAIVAYGAEGEDDDEALLPLGADGEEVAADEGADDLGVEMMTIIQLDVAEPGTVTPELAAQIYRYDRALLLADIRTAEWEVINWRQSQEETRPRDAEEADVCAGEAVAWGGTVDLLRAALRVAVER